MALLSTPQLTSVRLPLRKVKPAVPAFGISRVPLRVCRVAEAEDFGDKHPLYHQHDKMDHDLVMQLRAEKVEKYLKGWKPDHEMSSRWNVMTLLMMVAFASPLLGLGFAAATYGTLWGISAATQLPL